MADGLDSTASVARMSEAISGTLVPVAAYVGSFLQEPLARNMPSCSTMPSMAAQREHDRLIAVAAKAALAPIGCLRKGQSRVWISDQRFWAVQIEFQPSGWSKGSYLNVGAAWLWYPRKGLPFNYGYRVADFIPFEGAEQFTPLIQDMAAQAAREVLALRERFRTFADIHGHLVNNARYDDWPVYHAAVAAGLIGDVSTARQMFRRMEAWPTNGYDWEQTLKSAAAALAALLGEPAGFRAAVSEKIAQCRALNKLPPDPQCLDSAVTIDAPR
jgi:hypothetical protein